MTKTNCLNKALAILLSVLLALPLYVLSTAAENDGYSTLATSTSVCETGDQWYDCASLADDTGTASYATASFYLSDDGNTLKIEYTANDETVTELYDKNTQPMYFDYIRVLPAFGDPLPTSEDGLEDGAYWYDVDGLVALLQAVEEDETTINTIRNATFRLSVDGTILRMTTSLPGYDMYFHQDEFISQPDVLCGYLRQAGVDPVTQYEGFTQLPTSEDGLEDGDYWFDAAALAAAEGETVFLQALYYISDDLNTLRIAIAGTIIDVTRAEEPAVFAFLRQAGVDPNAGFTLLPTSDEGLEDGDYWFDAAGLAAEVGDEELQTQALYYLSDDGDTVRLITPSLGQLDIARDSDMGKILFPYLRQVGVDPNAIEGFILLPFSDEGLEDGDWWYDVALLAQILNDEDYLTYLFYLSDDGNTLRIKADGGSIDISRTDENADTYFGYLRQVGVDPYPGFAVLPKSDEGLAAGDYWYDAAAFAAKTNDTSYLRALYLLSDDGNTLRINEGGYTYDVTRDSGAAGTYFIYLHKVGESYTALPTSEDGLEVGAYWFDAAGFAAAAEDDTYLTAAYSLNEDAGILCVVKDGETSYYMNDMQYYVIFQFLKQAGVDPNAGFTALPTSEEGLEFGDWWYDAAGFAASEGIEEEDLPEFLTMMEFYRSDDGTTLRLVQAGYVMDCPVDDEEYAEFVAFLHQATPGYMPLPTSDEGLAYGDYWFDAASYAEASENDALLTYQYYLSEDGTTLRTVTGDGYVFDVQRDDEIDYAAFYFLRRIGVDPNAGFIPLPTSDDGLQNGEWWFDAAGLAAAEGDDSFLTTSYYLSEDGSELRIFYGGYPVRVLVDDANMADVVQFLHQVRDALDRDTVYVTMTAPDTAFRPGETVTVTVDLVQNPGLAGMTLALQYDAAMLTLTDVQASGMFSAGNLTPGGDLSAQPYNILWDDATAHENHTETGTILTLTFTVSDTATEGPTTVMLTYDTDATFDVDLQSVPVVISAATVTVTTRLPGDTDGDGEIDLADVAALTRYLAGGWDVTVREENCDVNGDGSLDLKDVILIRRYLAGGWGVELV